MFCAFDRLFKFFHLNECIGAIEMRFFILWIEGNGCIVVLDRQVNPTYCLQGNPNLNRPSNFGSTEMTFSIQLNRIGIFLLGQTNKRLELERWQIIWGKFENS